jgi:hypothetical protein
MRYLVPTNLFRDDETRPWRLSVYAGDRFTSIERRPTDSHCRQNGQCQSDIPAQEKTQSEPVHAASFHLQPRGDAGNAYLSETIL